MNNILSKNIVLVIAMLLSGFSVHSQWRMAPASNVGVYDIMYVNSSIGYEVGGNGLILKTINGGLSWQALASGVNNSLYSTFFISPTEGYAGGTILLKTLDGGITWIPITIAGSGGIISIYFINSSTGWFCTDSGKIYKTNDSGETWALQRTGGYLSSICFTSANNGWAVGTGNTVIKTTDGGITWTPVTILTSGAFAGSVQFISPTTGWISAGDGYVFRTTDGGATWTSNALAAATYLNETFFISTTVGWGATDNGIIKTTDGGSTWASTGSLSGNVSDISFYSNSNGTAVKGFAMNPYTTDGGSTWTYLSTTTGLGSNGYCVQFIDANNGWCAGELGMLKKTTDGGNTWVSLSSGTTSTILSVYFLNSTTGYFVATGGVIKKTTDGGLSWTSQVGGGGNTLYGVNFTSATNGIIASDYGVILRTTNGGTSWNSVTSGTPNTLRSVFFVSSTIGWIVGHGGVILTTSDGGVTWSPQTSGTTNNLLSVYFVNATTGYAVGASGTILKTTDGGSNWSTQNSTITDHLTTAYFSSATDGWVAGYGGAILHTGNGGTTWSLGLRLTVQPINAISFSSSTNAYAVCNTGYSLQYKINCTPSAPVNYTFYGGNNICTGSAGIIKAGGTGKVSWYSAPSGGTYLGTGSTYTTPVLNANTTYYAQDSTCSASTSRTSVSVNVSAIPTISSILNSNHCGTGPIAITIGSSASLGNVTWYSDPTAGNFLGTGNSFTTPTINSSTTYYAEAINAGCKSTPRTPILASITPIPTITSSSSSSNCGTGTVTIDATSDLGVVNWYTASSGGSSLGTGTSFITPVISASTIYYAEADNAGCLSVARTAVNAYINTTYPSLTTTVSGNSITANQTGVLYQWLDCSNGNSIITSETTQSYTPSISGNYSVELNLNGCIDTTACIAFTLTDVQENKKIEEFSFFPNPVVDKMTIEAIRSTDIESITSLKIINALGNLVLEKKNLRETNVIEMNSLSNGLYQIEIEANGKITRSTIVKQ